MKPVGYLILVTAIIGETGTILWERGYEILDVMIYVSKSVILTMLMSFCVVFILSYYLKRFLFGIFGVSVKSMVNWVIESPENHIYFFRTVGQLILNDGWFVFEFSVPLALICLFFELILYSTTIIESFRMHNALPTKKIHLALVFYQLFQSFLCCYLISINIGLFKKHFSLFFLSMFEISIELFTRSLLSIYEHYIFLSDRSFSGSSLDSELEMHFATHYTNLFNSLKFVLISGYRLYITWWSFYSNVQIVIALMEFFTLFDFLSEWRNRLKIVSQVLDDAKSEDILRDDTCIICRESMSLGKAKVLPCMHCCHTECLERWICRSPECPLCRYDLRHMVSPENNNINNEEDTEDVEEESINEVLVWN